MSGISGAKLVERRQEVDAEYARKIAAGELYYPYVQYPYFEWYSDNGRVVLELDPSQIMVIRPETPAAEKSPQELAQDRKKRAKAFRGFLRGVAEKIPQGEDR